MTRDLDPPSSQARPAVDEVRYVECPRDAWQGLPRRIPTARKRSHLELLLAAGFRHLDIASFVAAQAVPQMADSEAVLASLLRPSGVDMLGIVLNRRGLDRALAVPQLSSVGYPLSVSDTFQIRNSGRTIAASWPLATELYAAATDRGLRFVVYLSMGFGNPYGDDWRPALTARAVERLRKMGIQSIVLADTVGRADSDTVAAVLDAVDNPSSLGLHLHARRDDWPPLLDAGLERGVRWIEGALAGIGGCPFAGDALVGNLPTELVLPWLQRRGLTVVVAGDLLAEAARDAADVALHYGA